MWGGEGGNVTLYVGLPSFPVTDSHFFTVLWLISVSPQSLLVTKLALFIRLSPSSPFYMKRWTFLFPDPYIGTHIHICIPIANPRLYTCHCTHTRTHAHRTKHVYSVSHVLIRNIHSSTSTICFHMVKCPNSSILILDRTLIVTISPCQIGPESNEEILHIYYSSCIGASPSDVFVSYLGHSLGRSLTPQQRCSQCQIGPESNEEILHLY